MASATAFPSLSEPAQCLPTGDSSVSAPESPLVIASGVSDGKFCVWGESTRDYSESFKLNGGIFNKVTRKWEFDLSNQQTISELVDNIKKGNVKVNSMKHHANPKPKFNKFNKFDQSHQSQTLVLPIVGGGGSTAFPTVKGSDYLQDVTFKVFRPTVGMTARINVGKESSHLKVVQVENDKTNGYVRYVYLANGTGRTRLVVSDGHWQIEHYANQHQIYFNQ